jgi:hypothetical protein
MLSCAFTAALLQVGLGQNVAGYIGIVSSLAGNGAGVLAGVYINRFHRIKPTLVFFNAVNVCALVVFAIVVYPPFSSSLQLTSSFVLGAVWVTTILSFVLLNASVPLVFELAVENAFPVSPAFVVLSEYALLPWFSRVLLFTVTP